MGSLRRQLDGACSSVTGILARRSQGPEHVREDPVGCNRRVALCTPGRGPQEKPALPTLHSRRAAPRREAGRMERSALKPPSLAAS